MNSGNIKVSDLFRLFLNLSDKTILKRSDKYFASSSFRVHYTRKNFKKSHKGNKFKIAKKL